MAELPPLKYLHPEASLKPQKLAQMSKVSTEELMASLLPGQATCLKTRPDGTILDGHHRVFVLGQRGVEVDRLPREIMPKGNC